MLKAVIFDMDGVIVDSEPLHIKAERMLFAPLGIDVSDEELQSYMGRTPQILLADIIRKYGLDTTLDEVYPKHKENLAKLYRDEVKPIPGALDTIHSLRSSDIDLAIASSSDLLLISTVLDKFELDEKFASYVSGEEVKNVKPHPDIFLEAAQRLGVRPKECVVVEDSNAGVRAAKSAGMTCIGFESPNSPNQDLDLADLVVDDLTDLRVDLLNRLIEGEFRIEM